jgi:hypothetical protein
LIVGHAIGAFLLLVPVPRLGHRNGYQPKLCCGADA